MWIQVHVMGESMIYGVVVAGGSGTRVGLKKQYINLEGKPMWERSVDALVAGGVSRIWLVVPKDDVESLRMKLRENRNDVVVVCGGASRADSVRNAIEAIREEHHGLNDTWICIHDAARPFVLPADVFRVIEAAQTHQAAILGQKVVDTVKRTRANVISQTVPRDDLWLAQTPQVFSGPLFEELYQSEDFMQATDEASMLEAQGTPVYMVEATGYNGKVTTLSDVELAYSRARERWGVRLPRIRVGSGFDVHRFVHGRPLFLGGVEIPHDMGLEGHSDADVVLHAVMDACLGALALGDIGLHFPNTSDEFKGADSKQLARHVYRLICDKGYRLGNMDVMIMAEAPKISPHTASMQETMAQIFECEREQISIKATTMEKLGFVGRREGITAQATVLLEENR